jgi:DNA repair protein RadC
MHSVIVSFPEHERPRERLLAYGAGTLADRELLAMVLRQGSPQRNAIDLAADITAHRGSLQRLSTAAVDDLMTVRDMGLAKSAAVVAAFELGRRAALTSPAPFLRTSGDLARCAVPYFQGLVRERAVVIIADSALRFLRAVVLTEGNASSAVMATREILHAVLRSDGAAFGLAHNHPSGSLTSSADDRAATHAVRAAADVVGIRFLDHIIICGDEWISVEA